MNPWRAFKSVIRRRRDGNISDLSAHIRSIFDDDYYLAQNPDIAATEADPFTHYFNTGRFEFRRPSLFFDPEFYLEEYPDIAKSGIEPLEHYLSKGWVEGRFPTAHGFDANWYRETYLETVDSSDIPLIHYIREGLESGYSPNRSFDAAQYLRDNPDTITMDMSPFIHYLQFGLKGSLSARAVVKSLEHRVGEFQVVLRTEAPARLNLVIDALPSSDVPQDVIAALRQSVIRAQESGQQMRILTRTNRPDPTAMAETMQATDIPIINLEFDFAPADIGAPIEVSPSDTYVTNNWWNTKAVRAAVKPEQVTYLETDLDSEPVRSAKKPPKCGITVTTRSMAEVAVNSLRSQTANRKTLVVFVPVNNENQYQALISGLEWACEHGGLLKENWRILLHGSRVPRIVFSNGNAGISSSNFTDDQFMSLLQNAAVVVKTTDMPPSALVHGTDTESIGRTILEAVTR
jgi:hypothetical protein